MGVVYETIRGMVKGDRPPSTLLLREVCRVLALDFASMNGLLTTERVNRKYGHVLAASAKSNPELRPIEEAWPLLLPDEKEHVLLLVERYAERKKRRQINPSAPRILPRPVRKP